MTLNFSSHGDHGVGLGVLYNQGEAQGEMSPAYSVISVSSVANSNGTDQVFI